MDSEDKRILSLLQTEFPVVARPFDALAARHGRGPCRGRKRLGTEPAALVARVRRLAEAGIIRRIGPVFDSRRLGYTSTLAAARVPAERLAEVAERVNRLPGVTHNYERRGDYNLWFTLTALSEKEIARTLDALGEETGIVFHSLPALAVYKIRAVFGADDTPSGGPLRGGSGLSAVASATCPAKPKGRSRKAGDPPRDELQLAELDAGQKRLVRAIQDGLAIAREPFGPVAERAGRPVEEVLAQIRAWTATGLVRRFGAVVAHRRVGYRANGMAVFNLPADRVDEAGRALAERPEITHCYRRPPLPDFPYTLYAMIHGQSEEAVRSLADRLAKELNAPDHALLFSLTEFKKSHMRYFESEDLS